MESISAAEARKNLSELLNRVAYGKERLILTRHGKGIAALVPMEDVGLVDRIRRLTMRRSVEVALEEVEAEGGVRWETLRRELGL